MPRRLLALILPVTLAACTVENNGQAEFHPPLTYAKWETQKTGDRCTVTNGYRGISAVYTGGKAVSFGYTRKLNPGEVLSINVNGHRYETWHTEFAASDTAAMAQDFATADLAYLRLVRGGVQSFVDDNTLSLAGFSDAVKACSDKPAKSKKKSKKKSKMSAVVAQLFAALGAAPETGTLAVHAPTTGEQVASIKQDSAASLDAKIRKAAAAQKHFGARTRREREALVKQLSEALKAAREPIAKTLSLESGKTMAEAYVEADGSVNTLLKTIADATLAESGGMLRTKEREPVGNVGLITSFNFPLVVAFWSIAPALLAGNSVVWKPSEKTPLTALAVKAVFDQAMGSDKDLLQIAIGGREIGQALVAHEAINLISATGSVAMGKAIEATLAKKKGNAAPPILELGGNNGVIISDKISPEHLSWSLNALLNSFLGTTGQRCTNTRRLFVHRSLYDSAIRQLEVLIKTFMSGIMKNGAIDADNAQGYSALIDEDAFTRFEQAKKQAVEQGGKIVLGNRILAKEFPQAYYVEPALALLPKQTAVMHEETFAPILFVVPFDTLEEAIAMVNEPANAGLVNAIYTQSQKEADSFAYANRAGHSLINSPKGTGTPAHGMGFGGNKDSGSGEILNAADPLAAFAKPGRFIRIAQNKDVAMTS